MTCTLLHLYSLLGKKWTLLILQQLSHQGAQSFNQLANVLRVPTNRMLSTRLGELQEQGIILRKILETKPLHVEYNLTQKGRDLMHIIDAAKQWAISYGDAPNHCIETNCATCCKQELTKFRNQV